MSIRQGFLALLTERPMHGYQLRQEFEARTGGTWPLNIGQAYTTLARLQRDGLIAPLVPDAGARPPSQRRQACDIGGPGDDAASPQDQVRKPVGPTADAPERFGLTDAGRAEAQAWWSRPVERAAPARDELAIKLALAVTIPGVDVGAVVQRQRAETLRAMREATRLKRETPPEPPHLARSLVIESLIFAAEAEVRWLDHVESAVTKAAAATRSRGQEETQTPEQTSSPTGGHQ